MTFEARLIVIVLAAFTAATLLATAFVPAAVRHAARVERRRRADALFAARLLPVAAGLMTALFALSASFLFERRDPEPIGLVLPALAACALGLMTAGLAGLTRTVVATRGALARWMRSAEPVELPELTVPAFAIDAPFPLVAVVGALRPRLVIARTVLRACPDDELRAILVHEQHHVERRDNLKRALMSALPDLFSVLPAGRTLRGAWQDAGEDAADDAVERLGTDGRVALAQALVRVARLAAPCTVSDALPASALYRGGGLERRVRRLLAPQTPPADHAVPWMRLAGLTLVLSATLALESVHHVIELAVTRLP